MLHCHILHHTTYDNVGLGGLMMVINVVKWEKKHWITRKDGTICKKSISIFSKFVWYGRSQYITPPKECCYKPISLAQRPVVYGFPNRLWFVSLRTVSMRLISAFGLIEE
jgi:hypothetical protein